MGLLVGVLVFSSSPVCCHFPVSFPVVFIVLPSWKNQVGVCNSPVPGKTGRMRDFPILNFQPFAE